MLLHNFKSVAISSYLYPFHYINGPITKTVKLGRIHYDFCLSVLFINFLWLITDGAYLTA